MHNAFTRIFPSVVANGLISLLSGVRVHDCGCGLKAYRREVLADRYVPKGFMNRFSPVAFGVKNSEFAELEVTDRHRQYGQSHYGLKRVFIVANDLLVLPFLRFPLRQTHAGLQVVNIAAVVATMGSIVLVWQQGGINFIPALGFILLYAVCRSVHWNLGRFIDAQEQPAFRVRDFR